MGRQDKDSLRKHHKSIGQLVGEAFTNTILMGKISKTMIQCKMNTNITELVRMSINEDDKN